MVVSINREKCLTCGGCVSVCPLNIIELNGNRIEVDQEKCIKCGACARLCPVGAIKVE